MNREMDRRTFLKGSLATAAASTIPSQALGEENQKPNIIFFMMDQLATKWLWGPASKCVALPNFDRLRARGVAFTSARVSNPICCASRASLATGLYTRGHGVLQNGYTLDPAIPTFMRELQRSGYATGGFGKIHYHAQFAGVHPDYYPYGYDVVFNTEDPRSGFWLDWVAKEHPEHLNNVLACVGETAIPELRAYGPDKINLYTKIKAIQKNFQWATPEFPNNTPSHYTLPFPPEISQVEWITTNAIDFISHTDRAKPVYAHISYVTLHEPSCPSAEHMRMVDESLIPPPAGVEWVNNPTQPKCFPTTQGAHQAIPADWRTLRHYYFADLSYMDAQLGRITQALEQAGRLDNTYFIMLSDHGSLLLDHGFTGKGERHYDSCVHIPLTIAGPGLQKGATRDQMVQLEDIFPTVMEMAGLPMPEPLVIPGADLDKPFVAEAERYPGCSLMGLCRGEQPSGWRDAIEIESYNNSRWTTTDYWARTICTKDWRYTFYPRNTGEQMYSLKNDPDEQTDLSHDPAYASVRTEMRDRLLDQIVLQDFPHTRRDCFSLGTY